MYMYMYTHNHVNVPKHEGQLLVYSYNVHDTHVYMYQ